MANFNSASETNPLKIKLAIRDSARAENPNRAKIFSPGEWAEKSEKILCNGNGISARAEKLETRLLLPRSRSNFSGIKASK